TAQDVDELRDLVELRRLQPLADCRELRLRPLHELLAEIGPEPRLGVGPQGPELQHREDAPAAPDALAPVEDRRSARQEDDERDRESHRERQEEKEPGEDDVEGAEQDVAGPRRRFERQLPVAADEGVLDSTDARPWRRRSRHNECLWTRASWLRSARSSNGGASRRPPTSSA